MYKYLLLSLTSTPHQCPLLLYSSFIFSLHSSYLACISSPLILFVILLLSSHLSSSSLPSSPLFAIHHLCSPLFMVFSSSVCQSSSFLLLSFSFSRHPANHTLSSPPPPLRAISPSSQFSSLLSHELPLVFRSSCLLLNLLRHLPLL